MTEEFNTELDLDSALRLTDRVFLLAGSSFFERYVGGGFSSYMAQSSDKERIAKLMRSWYASIMGKGESTHFYRDWSTSPDRHKIAACITLSIIKTKPLTVNPKPDLGKPQLYFLANELTAFLFGASVVNQYSDCRIKVPSQDYYIWICKALADADAHTEHHGTGTLMFLANIYYLLETYSKAVQG